MSTTRTPVRFRVFIAAPSTGMRGEHGDIPALLDMLRYEAGTVVSWDRDTDARDRDGWTVTIETRHPAPDRWRSFGIRPESAVPLPPSMIEEAAS
jgi:hypothetical protein